MTVKIIEFDVERNGRWQRYALPYVSILLDITAPWQLEVTCMLQDDTRGTFSYAPVRNVRCS